MSIPRKFKEDWTGRLPVRFLFLSNELPRLADASGAMASRFIILTLKRSWFGNEDTGLTERLLGELPGILNWAIEGWKRLQERGHFIQPDASQDAIAQLEELGSPVAAFVSDKCVVGPGRSVQVDELYRAWKTWCDENGREHYGTVQTFGRDLRAAVPGLRVSQPRAGGGRMRFYDGIDLARSG